MIEEDSEFIKVLGGSIAKAVFWICLAICFCFSVSTCSLEPDTIISCEESCSSAGGKMESVTNSKCVCTSVSSIESLGQENIWVLPRN